ncbi:hypothetical protein BC349_19090 [Flavihumibacter stibioxidans]|uniref:Phosphatidic acid phosphatase type 2/haloperoxidase domain-containing protein n=2 Tax=Flavihumibacter stibioxidans TaxID=1834163 RepID=A0ABR7MEH2_9BACT|nr:hypothetical protein [Flavihumibacter stibioxidans]
MAQTPGFDYTTLIELNEHRRHEPTEFYQGISNSVGKISLAIPASMMVAGMFRSDKELRQKALYIGESLAVSGIITSAMKYSFRRDRPFVSYRGQIQQASSGGSPSFPSGHTSQAFATATSLYLAYPRWYVALPAFGWASTVGYSRMYLGVHYPSDVAVGALVGAGSAWLTWKANTWMHHRKSHKHSVRRLTCV